MLEDPSLFAPAASAETASDACQADDQALHEVTSWFRRQPRFESRFGSIFRQSFDEVLDGQRTGRYDIDGVSKTEKTYLGTKVEIITRSTFGLPQGAQMDYSVEGHEVDAKFSLTSQWQIPGEAMGHLCLLMSAKEREQTFEAGLLRITEAVLNKGRNQDKKATISSAAKQNITWLCRDAPLPPNILLLMQGEEAEQIMAQTSGQRRINQLLRVEQGRVIDRNTALTVAKQADGLKRCRDARSALKDEGIVVLGHQQDSRRIASELGIPPLQKGTFMSVRLVPVPVDTADRKVTTIDGGCYAIATKGEPAHPVPEIQN
ncbi:NaeI family type II restriction endonuclease [Saccharopolyspora sp. NPDC047091]|uniref:NaeI family type II restriction endonuclease n=1 Tax=Saccharopolyspora sp. NPDC047091 TaxID=3155924 RepID=UPI0033FB9436